MGIKVTKKIKYGTASITVEVGTVTGKTGMTKNGYQWCGGPVKVKVENRNHLVKGKRQ